MFMASLDIKDAYYSISIHEDSKKLYKFEHDNQLYVFMALPNGYTAGPRKFTKVIKPSLAKEKVTLMSEIFASRNVREFREWD